MKTQIFATVPREVVNKIKEAADNDRRNFSNMVSVLLAESLEKRKAANPS